MPSRDVTRMAPMVPTFCRKIRKTFQARNQQLNIQGDENINEELPDRVVNPDMYQPLLPATKNGEGNSQSDRQTQAGVNSLAAYGSM